MNDRKIVDTSIDYLFYFAKLCSLIRLMKPLCGNKRIYNCTYKPSEKGEKEMAEAIEIIRENLALLLPLFILQLVLMTIALIDLSRNDDPNGPKWIWAIVIIFVNTIGPIIYFIFGKRR